MEDRWFWEPDAQAECRFESCHPYMTEKDVLPTDEERVCAVLLDIVENTSYSEHIEYRIRAAELLAKIKDWGR